MRMFVVSIIGLAGLVGVFVYCTPLRDRAQAVILGQSAIAQPTGASAQPDANVSGGVQSAEASGGGM